jgi:hypothetical protein
VDRHCDEKGRLHLELAAFDRKIRRFEPPIARFRVENRLNEIVRQLLQRPPEPENFAMPSPCGRHAAARRRR